MNEFGYKLQEICKLMLNDIKIIALTGTLLNTRWEELAFVANIFLGEDKYNVDELS